MIQIYEEPSTTNKNAISTLEPFVVLSQMNKAASSNDLKCQFEIPILTNEIPSSTTSKSVSLIVLQKMNEVYELFSSNTITDGLSPNEDINDGNPICTRSPLSPITNLKCEPSCVEVKILSIIYSQIFHFEQEFIDIRLF